MCYWKTFFRFKHLWHNMGVSFSNTPLIFRRPMGESKLVYCERCGKVKVVGVGE